MAMLGSPNLHFCHPTNSTKDFSKALNGSIFTLQQIQRICSIRVFLFYKIKIKNIANNIDIFYLLNTKITTCH